MIYFSQSQLLLAKPNADRTTSRKGLFKQLLDHSVYTNGLFKQQLDHSVHQWTIEAAVTPLFKQQLHHSVSRRLPILGALFSIHFTLCTINYLPSTCMAKTGRQHLQDFTRVWFADHVMHRLASEIQN